nr:MAG TPA: hypothetical protein [Caudoviricetes sp.]
MASICQVLVLPNSFKINQLGLWLVSLSLNNPYPFRLYFGIIPFLPSYLLTWLIAIIYIGGGH